MRFTRVVCLISGALLLGALPASPLPYSGSLTIAFQRYGEVGRFVQPLAGDGVSTPTRVDLGSVRATTSTVWTVATTQAGAPGFPFFPVVSLALSGPAGIEGGTFSAGGGPAGGFGGEAPLLGVGKISLFGPPPFAFLTVRLDPVGVPGATGQVVSPGGVNITALGEGWTTGSVEVLGTTGPFRGLVLASASGTDARTAGGLGSIVLVTPSLVRANVAGFENFPVIARLELTFVPEPGTLVLLGVGVALLSRRP